MADDTVAPSADTKQCCDCREDLPRDSFARNRATSDGLANMCKPCKKVYNAAYYERTKHVHNPGRYKRRVDHRLEVRLKLIEYLADKACVDCGETDLLVLDFDHQRDKVANVGEMLKKGVRWARVLEEIQKCEVVCANDHRRRTARMQGWIKLLVGARAASMDGYAPDS